MAEEQEANPLRQALAGLFGFDGAQAAEPAAAPVPESGEAVEPAAPVQAPNPSPIRDRVYINGLGQRVRIKGSVSKEKALLMLKRHSLNQFNRQVNIEEEQLRPGIIKSLRVEKAEQELGAPLAKTPGGNLKEFEDKSLRFDLARSNLISEKALKLKDSLPNADIRTFDWEGDKVIAIRKQGEKEYTLLDSSDFLTVSDLVEIGGLVLTPEIATQIIAAVATSGKTLTVRALAQVAGGFIGRTLDVGIESARGFNEDPIREILTEAPLSGVFAGAGEVGFAPLRRVVRGATGKGAIEMTPEELLAQATAREAGFSLTPGQLHPFIQSMERQAAAFSKPVQTKLREQLKTFRDNIASIQKEAGDPEALGQNELAELIQKMEKEVFDLVTNRALTLDKGGDALKRGRVAYVKWAKRLIGKRYDDAIEAGDGASFNLAQKLGDDNKSVQDLAREILDGVKSRGLKKEEASSIIDPVTGQPFKLDKESAEQIRKLNGELKEKLEQVLKLDPNVETFEGSTAFEQIKELRSSLFDLKNATVDGKEDISNRFAGQLWSKLTNLMDNPTGGSEEFRHLIRRANRANAIFEKRLDIVDLKQIAMGTKPYELVGMVAEPGNGRVLRMLMRIMPDEEYGAFREAWKTSVLSQPEKIGQILDAWRVDPSGLKALLTPEEEFIFRKFGRDMKKLKDGPAKKLLDADVANSEITERLINDSSSDTLAKMISTAGGKTSPQGKALGGGLIQTMLNESTALVKGQDLLNPAKFVEVVKRYEKSGKLAAILPDDVIEMLKDRQALASFLESTSDVGVSLQKAEAAAAVGKAVLIPIQGEEAAKATLRGMLTITKNALIGRILMSRPGQLFFTGLGDIRRAATKEGGSEAVEGAIRQPDLTTLRALSGWLGSFVSRLENASEQEFPRTE